jgi:transposase
MAQLMQMGSFRPVHVKTLPAQEVRALLTGRKLLLGKLRDIELGIRGLLRGFGLNLGVIGKGKYAARIRELVGGHPILEPVSDAMQSTGKPASGVCHAASKAAQHRAR